MIATLALTRRGVNDTPFGHEESCGERRSLWSLARGARRGALGHRERLAHPAQYSLRRGGDRLLGACAHPVDVPAHSRSAAQGDSKDRWAHVGFSALLRIL